VIEHLDAEHVPGRREAAREVDVIGRWCRIAGRVIVRLMCPESLCGRGQWEPPITPVDTLIAAT
jgi:hypothetical protein